MRSLNPYLFVVVFCLLLQLWSELCLFPILFHLQKGFVFLSSRDIFTTKLILTGTKQSLPNRKNLVISNLGETFNITNILNAFL